MGEQEDKGTTDVRTYGRMDRHTDRGTDGQTDGTQFYKMFTKEKKERTHTQADRHLILLLY